MNRVSLLLFSFIVLCLASCREIDKLLTFRINQSQTVTLPARSILPGAIIGSLPITTQTNSEESFKNNNTQANLVKDVVLEKLVLTIADPADEDFSFLRDMTIYIDADDAPEVKLAYANDIPNNVGKTLELTSTNAKLDAYIKAKSFTVRTQATTDETVSRDITIKLDMTFKVTADPIQ